MPYCYYCGIKLEEDDVYCGGCGKRVVSSVSRKAKPEAASSAKPKSAAKKKAAAASKPKPAKESKAKEPKTEERPLTHKIYVSGDVHASIFADKRSFEFTEGNGQLICTVRGKREVIDGGFFVEDHSESVYRIKDDRGEVAGEVEFREITGEDSYIRTTFHTRLWTQPGEPSKQGFFQKAQNYHDSEGHEFESQEFYSVNDLLGFNKTTKAVGSYRAVSEGKLFSFIPARTDVTLKRDHVASVEPEGDSYRIDYEGPEHVLTAVMIFLALYAKL